MIDLNWCRPPVDKGRPVFNYMEKSIMDDITAEYTNREIIDTQPRRNIFYNATEVKDIYPTSREDLEEFVIKNYVLREAINNIEANVLPYKYIVEELTKQEAGLSTVALSLVDPKAIAATEAQLKAVREALAILPKYYPDEETTYYYN